MRRAAAAVLALVLAARAAAAQSGDCFPPPDSHEAQAFGIFSVPLAYSGAAAPRRVSSGAVTAGLEVVYLPRVSDEIATPTICRPGKGPENTNLLFALPRPRAAVGLPGGFALDLSWVPPVRVNDVKANLFGLALGRAFAVGSGGTFAVRGHATLGQINAPVTCDEEALQDPQSECFGGQLSNDRYEPNIFGVDGSLGWSVARGRLRPYAGGGYNRLQPRFQVHFVNRFGVLDDRRVEVNLNRGVVFGGATWTPSPVWGITGEVYAAPADAVTGRVVVRARL